MFQLGTFKTGRVLVCAAAAVVAVTALGTGSAQAVVETSPLLSTELGGGCATPVVDSPVAGETTITDTTAPTVTSVTRNHSVVIAGSGASVRFTVKVTDDCAGSADVMLELYNHSTHEWAYPDATGFAAVVTATGVNETWTFDIPLRGTDVGSISVYRVDVASGFDTLTYHNSATPTEADIVDPGGVTPDPNNLGESDYVRHVPAVPVAVVVKAFTKLAVNATPEPAKVGHSVSVKATLTKLYTSTFVADGSQYVTLQYHLPGSSTWHSIKKVKTNTKGVASTTFKVTKRGTYGFRAVYAGSTYAAAVHSGTDGVSAR